MSKKVLIVGGVAGGASAAARLRRLNEDFEIIMFEKGEYISFANRFLLTTSCFMICSAIFLNVCPALPTPETRISGLL